MLKTTWSSATSSSTVEEEAEVDVGMEYTGPQGVERIQAVIKLGLIIVCYATAFVSLVKMGFWLAADPEFGPVIIPTGFIEWIETKWTYKVWWDTVTYSMLYNLGLLLTFGIQHTFMAQRHLEGTSFWMRLHYEYKIDRPLYIVATAIVLLEVIRQWTSVPILMWPILPWLKGWYQYVHVVAWASLYGTSLMLDLPEMTGFNQVVINSPTVTQKSPDLQMMYRTQRHMGLLPFLIILVVHPTMTLDRFLLTICTGLYTYFSWRSTGSYEYASRMKQMKKRRL